MAARRLEGGIGAALLVARLIDALLRHVPLAEQDQRPLQLLGHEGGVALALGDEGGGLLPRLAGLTQLRLGGAQRGLQVADVEPRQLGPGLDHLAFVHQHLGDAGRVLGGDVDLVGFDAAVARGEAGGKPAAGQQVRHVDRTDGHGDQQQGCHEQGFLGHGRSPALCGRYTAGQGEVPADRSVRLEHRPARRAIGPNDAACHAALG